MLGFLGVVLILTSSCLDENELGLEVRFSLSLKRIEHQCQQRKGLVPPLPHTLFWPRMSCCAKGCRTEMGSGAQAHEY